MDERNFKPLSWTKQKVDKKVNGEIVSKVRDSIESQVYPTAKIIDDVTSTGTQLFVDNARFFNYEEDFSSLVVGSVGGLIVGSTNPVAAGFTAVVSAAVQFHHCLSQMVVVVMWVLQPRFLYQHLMQLVLV